MFYFLIIKHRAQYITIWFAQQQYNAMHKNFYKNKNFLDTQILLELQLPL